MLDKANSQLAIPSANAKPLPAHLAQKSQTTTEDPASEVPKTDSPFYDPNSPHKWAEFSAAKLPPDAVHVPIDLEKPKSWWFYLGKTSTEAKAQYTADPAISVHEPASSFLDSVRPVIQAPPPVQKRSHSVLHPLSTVTPTLPRVNASIARAVQQVDLMKISTPERPYTGKYAIKDSWPHPQIGRIDSQAFKNQQAFLKSASAQSLAQYPGGASSPQSFQAPPAAMGSGPPALPTMDDIHRRSSNAQNSVEEYKRVSPMDL